MRVLLLFLVAVGCWAQEERRELQPLQAAWRKTMAAEIGDEETLDLYASQVMERCEAMRSRALTLRNLLLVENPSYEVRREQFFNAGMLVGDSTDLLSTKYVQMARIVDTAHRPQPSVKAWVQRGTAMPEWPKWGLDAFAKTDVLCREIGVLFGKSDARTDEALPNRLTQGITPWHSWIGMSPSLPTP